jgi:hypothetical protein
MSLETGLDAFITRLGQTAPSIVQRASTPAAGSGPSPELRAQVLTFTLDASLTDSHAFMLPGSVLDTFGAVHVDQAAKATQYEICQNFPLTSASRAGIPRRPYTCHDAVVGRKDIRMEAF